MRIYICVPQIFIYLTLARSHLAIYTLDGHFIINLYLLHPIGYNRKWIARAVFFNHSHIPHIFCLEQHMPLYVYNNMLI